MLCSLLGGTAYASFCGRYHNNIRYSDTATRTKTAGLRHDKHTESEKETDKIECRGVM